MQGSDNVDYRAIMNCDSKDPRGLFQTCVDRYVVRFQRELSEDEPLRKSAPSLSLWIIFISDLGLDADLVDVLDLEQLTDNVTTVTPSTGEALSFCYHFVVLVLCKCFLLITLLNK